MSKTVTLKPSQKQLFASWENELRNIQQQIGGFFNELVLFRLEKIAAELGVDTEAERWTFDFQKKAFISADEKPQPELTIPGKKRGRPKKDIVVDAELVEEEPLDHVDHEEPEPQPEPPTEID